MIFLVSLFHWKNGCMNDLIFSQSVHPVVFKFVQNSWILSVKIMCLPVHRTQLSTDIYRRTLFTFGPLRTTALCAIVNVPVQLLTSEQYEVLFIYKCHINPRNERNVEAFATIFYEGHSVENHPSLHHVRILSKRWQFYRYLAYVDAVVSEVMHL